MIGRKRVWTGIIHENPNVVDDPYGDFRYLDGTQAIIKRYVDEDPSAEEDVFLKWGGSNAPDNHGNEEDRVEIYVWNNAGYFLNDLPKNTADRFAFCERMKRECLEGIYILISCEFL